MFPVSEAILSEKKNGFSSHSGHKTSATIVSDFGRGGFGCGGGDGATSLRCQWWRRWGLAEENELKDSEAVEKVRETGGSGIIIGEILCLLFLRKLPILHSPLSFSPLHG